jgi:hypothetical protein
MQHSIHCPQPGCAAPAGIVDRWTWTSTDGPVEHVKTWCVNGHGFTPPLDTLTIQPALPEPVAGATVG